MMSPPPVAVVIPNWNGGERLSRVLRDLGRQSLRPAHVLVVDNGSEDHSAGSAEDSGAAVIRLGSNRGFAPAVNAGLRRLTPEYPLVAILNNDVELDPDWLSRLTAGLLHFQDASFATGKIYSLTDPSRLDGAFDLISRGLTAWRAGHGRTDAPEWNRPRYIGATSLTAALFKRTVFDQIGLLDERFVSYLEDVDLSIRCSLAGLVGAYIPDAVCSHWGSATWGAWSPQMVRSIARNQRLLAAKYGSSRQTMVAQLLWGLLALRHGAFLAWLDGRRADLPAVQNEPKADPDQLLRVLESQERELRRLQQPGGLDTYWKLYFLLS